MIWLPHHSKPIPGPQCTLVVEDYLKAIWMVEQNETPVSTSRVAERLSLTAAAVTAMVKRLAEQKLLRHEPYYGVQLTAAGEMVALRIIRRHRVLELFLVELLGYGCDRVHDEAERLEHAASDELIERLAKLLGEPERVFEEVRRHTEGRVHESVEAKQQAAEQYLNALQADPARVKQLCGWD